MEWANPVWQALGVDPHREAERISASVRRVVANLEAPPASALEITDAALGVSALPVLQRPADPQPQYGSWVLALAIVVASWVHRPRNPVDAPEAEEPWQPEGEDAFESDAVVVHEANVFAARVEERAVSAQPPASPLQPPGLRGRLGEAPTEFLLHSAALELCCSCSRDHVVRMGCSGCF